jgi:hypothetical protein
VKINEIVELVVPTLTVPKFPLEVVCAVCAVTPTAPNARARMQAKNAFVRLHMVAPSFCRLALRFSESDT